MSYPLITICGSYHLTKPWVIPCLKSLNLIKNLDSSNFYVIPDSNLDTEGQKEFVSLGFKTIDQSHEDKITTSLKNYPYLSHMREKELFWKKMLDISILFKEYDKIVYVDTDVLITREVILPEGDFDIAYMREDVPAYDAHWKIVWNEKMIPALQGGLVIFNPSIVDLEYLEVLVKKYFIGCVHTWWTEQAAWACLAGRTKKRKVFSGQQVRALSGLKKRTYHEIINNQYKYVGSNEKIENFNDFEVLSKKAAIIHFAGLGKRWFEETYRQLATNSVSEIEKIEMEEDYNMGFIDKIFISFRLYIKYLINSRKK